MSTSNKKVSVDGGGFVKYTVSNGKGSGQINAVQKHRNTGVVEEYTDQGNYIAYRKDLHTGCIGNTVNQTNGDNCEITGGRKEVRCEGSRYTIVGDAQTPIYHSARTHDELYAKTIGYRSTFNDDRNEFDPKKLVPSPGKAISEITSSVSNQTNNKVKYPPKPEETGNFLIDILNALGWELDCMVYRVLRQQRRTN